jgi:phenylalanyl-tRNA synthetase alpha chain
VAFVARRLLVFAPQGKPRGIVIEAIQVDVFPEPFVVARAALAAKTTLVSVLVAGGAVVRQPQVGGTPPAVFLIVAAGTVELGVTAAQRVPRQRMIEGAVPAHQSMALAAVVDVAAAALGSREAATGGGPFVDVTEPGLPMGEGRRHILSRTIDEITEVFARMGFTVAYGPELEDEHHNFTALNIPADHPAREATDNFYLQASRKESDERKQDSALNALLMLRSQTSTVQIRTMEKVKPPLKVISIGRVYRPDTHDATHYSMFHQVEGLYIDRGVSMVDLKTTLFQFARAYFGEQAEVRIRPSFFPFTEPSAEVDMKMKVKDEWKWVELGGCGMVDPNVFQTVGYDAEEWTGFAFGLGIERIAMRRYGISDIRWLFENDARFLRQF